MANELVKFGLIGVGGYILYKYVIEPYLSPQVVGTTAVSGSQVDTTATANNADTGGAATNASPQSYSYPTVTSQQLYEIGNFAPGSGATPDQWAWLYHAKTGKWIDGSLMDNIFGTVGNNSRGMGYSAEEFISKISSSGQGFAGLSIERASGWERAIKYRN